MPAVGRANFEVRSESIGNLGVTLSLPILLGKHGAVSSNYIGAYSWQGYARQGRVWFDLLSVAIGLKAAASIRVAYPPVDGGSYPILSAIGQRDNAYYPLLDSGNKLHRLLLYLVTLRVIFYSVIRRSGCLVVSLLRCTLYLA